ncbi:hypothetical protein IC620_14620 [Hazenella sp. IB182357]|uniref:Uncharacterized protein n=1 Tax=Polycladospora coralii TaxID=2771432 RepID=A0A926N6U5_9BACL|nr:hypothetical protein [Polycladospora coralii]MBD1373579.1 hypothetical protein [Polycladospora coralii]
MKKQTSVSYFGVFIGVTIGILIFSYTTGKFNWEGAIAMYVGTFVGLSIAQYFRKR